MMPPRRTAAVLSAAVVLGAWACPAPAADAAPAAEGTVALEAKDTFAPPAGETPEQKEALAAMQWKAGPFQVKRSAADAKATAGGAEGVVSFPSPLPGGDAKRDTVVLHWHRALGADGQPLAAKAPAVVVLSPLAPDMLAQADQMAERLSKRGLHAFAMALPGCGPRDADPRQDELVESAAHATQAAADLRRARDAVAALPEVNGKVGLQALCFGALAAVPAQGLDNAFDAVVIGFVGGDLKNFFKTLQGTFFRMPFTQAGWSDAEIDDLAATVEPGRLAGRVDAAKMHFFSFNNDGLWPNPNRDHLLAALKLPAERRTELPGAHWNMVSQLGKVEKQMQQMLGAAPAAAKPQ